MVVPGPVLPYVTVITPTYSHIVADNSVFVSRLKLQIPTVLMKGGEIEKTYSVWFVAKCFKKEHKLSSYKGKTILEAKRPLLMFSLEVEFYLAFHTEGKKTLLVLFISP